MRSVWVAARRRWRRPSVAPNQPARLLHRPSSFHAPVRLSRELRRAARCAVWVGLRGAAAPCASRLLQVVAAAVCISAGRLVLLQLQCASNAPRKLGVAASAVQLAGSGLGGCDRQCKYRQRAGCGSGSQEMWQWIAGPRLHAAREMLPSRSDTLLGGNWGPFCLSDRRPGHQEPADST